VGSEQAAGKTTELAESITWTQRIGGFSTTMRYINRHYLSIHLSIGGLVVHYVLPAGLLPVSECDTRAAHISSVHNVAAVNVVNDGAE